MKTKKIGDFLLEKGFITTEQLQEALQQQTTTGRRLGDILVEQEYISEEQLCESMSERLSIPKVALESLVIDPQIIHTVPVHIARRYTIIPAFSIGNTLTLAMADPLNIIAIDEVKYLTGMNVQRAIATPTEIRGSIDKYYSIADSLSQIIGAEQNESLPEIVSADDISGSSDSPIIKLVNLIITKAVTDNASDIHIEPEENRTRIRYRIHGVMREEASPPKSMQNELVSRIKIASNLDVSEKRLPQDGRFMIKLEGATIDLRVSTLPTIHGEKVVIRILDRRNLLLSFNQLGMNKRIEDRWKDNINQSEGLVLISGPTSSGKTSTLYTTLQEINTVEKNTVTIEDPVEYSLPLIIQIQINEKAGLTFPSVLRSILRQNPDTIMIGEIRDTETARLAVRSALTGHMVFSTIHTNDAPSAISRLTDMGVEKYLVASSIRGVLAQRLVRANCPECRTSYVPTDLDLSRAGLIDLADELKFTKGKGCRKCLNTGFKGRTGIYEFLEITPKIAELVVEGASLNQLKNEARRNGYMPLFEMGLEKLAEGTICLEELLKETTNMDDFKDSSSQTTVRTQDANAI
ncbi:MAG: ATPase, T2SS/T4P/T4SS family [bacterium]|nr:ATPase, T2SS/T4P/T4SS family [bacterium]